MFRASSAHLQEETVVYMQHMVLSLCMRVPGGLSVHTFLYMFRASSAHLQEDTVVHMQHMVLSLSMRDPGGLCIDRPPGTLTESDSTICCMCTTVSS